MARPPRLVSQLLSLLAVLASGCSPSASVTGASDGGLSNHDGDLALCKYTPEVSDFFNYHQWTTYREDSGLTDSVPSTLVDGGVAVVHDDGLRIEYVKFLGETPKHGETQFPCGTLIVKEIPSQMQVFAMAKRGAGYNAYDGGSSGSIPSGWEWAELSGSEPQTGFLFLWDGLPPDTQVYSGNNPYVCNECHSVMGHNNDFVASPRIRLENY